MRKDSLKESIKIGEKIITVSLLDSLKSLKPEDSTLSPHYDASIVSLTEDEKEKAEKKMKEAKR
jgi:hypothetical protein